jgi:hypothetical protein
MEARMDMQGMPMREMHNTFWRKKQVVVTFHSTTPLVSSEGVNQGGPILKQLNLEAQRQKLNTFLTGQGLNYTLNFYQPVKDDDSQASRPLEGRRSPDQGAGQKGRGSFNPPPGVYLFGLSEPIQSDFGKVATSIVTFFDFAPKGDAVSSGRGDDGDGKEPPDNQSPVVGIVNTFNKGLRTLNGQQVLHRRDARSFRLYR